MSKCQRRPDRGGAADAAERSTGDFTTPEAAPQAAFAYAEPQPDASEARPGLHVGFVLEPPPPAPFADYDLLPGEQLFLRHEGCPSCALRVLVVRTFDSAKVLCSHEVWPGPACVDAHCGEKIGWVAPLEVFGAWDGE